ncbi:TPA: YPDG domain-containing protein, partial [Staphylococcus delphini]|nr:YPDG domain-containing protein [Staphylococcus delphini]
MKKSKKPKRLDFLPNKLNKYSIRKFTVGTASILIGSLLYLGIQNQADASEIDEQTKAETQKATNDSLQSDEEHSALNVVESQNVEANTAEEVLPEAASETQEYAQQSTVGDSSQSDKIENKEVTSTEEKTVESIDESQNIENSDDQQQVEEPSTEETKVEGSKSTDQQTRSTEKSNDTVEKKETAQPTAQEETKANTVEKVEHSEQTLPQNNSLESETAQNEASTDAQFDEAVAQNLPKNFNVLSDEEAKAAIEYAKLKAYAEKMNQQPTAALLNLSTSPSNAFYRSAFRAAGDTTTQMVRVTGTNHFQKYGDVTEGPFPQEFPNDGVLTAINQNSNVNTGTKGALQFDKQIGFDKDFTIKVPIANNNVSNTTGSDGWGFIFTKGNGQDFLQNGGILRNQGMADAAGFKIDTSYNNIGGQADTLDKDKTRNLANIGNFKIGYGTFVKNDATGTTQQVGSDAINSKDKPINKIEFGDNAPDFNDGKFHGQRLNDFVLKYDANSSTLTVEYAGKTWTATVDQLGLNKNDKYNFLITSSQMPNRYSNGIMRTKLSGVTIDIPAETPQADVHNPGYNESHTKPSVPVAVPQTGDTSIPPNTKFEIPPNTNLPNGWTAEVNPNTGVVTVTPPADATPGTSVDVPVKVTYPDGSSEETPAKVTVDPNQAQENTPGYNESHTKPSVPVTVPQTGDTSIPPNTKFEIPPNTNLPNGWTAEIDPNTGVVTVTPPADATPGTSVDVPVKVTYPDGSSEETPAKV